jgi:pyrimidine deaminase RibD-like protein
MGHFAKMSRISQNVISLGMLANDTTFIITLEPCALNAEF